MMTHIQRHYAILNLLIDTKDGKGCKLCYLCNHWLGPPFTFHKEGCPVPELMKQLEKRASGSYI